jgi:hypothetical protein
VKKNDTKVSGNSASGDPTADRGNSGGLGALSFTGAESADLAILGGTAVVAGRVLYAFGRRGRKEEDEFDPVDGAGPSPAD